MDTDISQPDLDHEPSVLPSPVRITGAEAVAATLAELEVDTIFGYPGGAIMPIYDALYDHPELRHVLVRHEQAAVHAAEGLARATGKPAVCMATSGPGATNFITGLADALMDSTPVICITGQVFSDLLGGDAFQEADVVGMTLSCTKWNCQVADPADIPLAIRTAYRAAMEGRPGPVLIDITKDAQINTLAAEADGTLPQGGVERSSSVYYQNWHYAARQRDLNAVEQAARLINEAERPLLLVGQGVQIAEAEAELLAVAERGQIPMAATLLGLSAIATDHALYTGLLGMHGNYAPNMLTNEADVLIAVGMRFDDRVTGRLDGYAPDARVVHIDIDPAEIGKNVPVECALVGDAREVLTALLPTIERQRREAWRQRFRTLDEREMSAVIRPELFPAEGPLRMGEVVRDLSAQTDGNAIMVADVGQHQMMVARYYEFRRTQSHISSGGLGTMGFALPAAIGAAIGRPDRPVIAVIGDGGFQMTMQELGTVMQEQVPVKIVILNNGYLGMVRQWQEMFFDRRYSQVHMQNPDFVAMCAAFRIPARRVSERTELPDALQTMLDSNGPFLLEVMVGQEDNVFPMIPAGAAVDEIRLD
ncbi:MAG: biosynthetic-type acetolactate synthase large subunit [Pseudomonadota bacterium]